ncbi:MAG: hypothetical protein R3F55_25730 [Alphaproteobacteria bacterium]
MPLTICNNVDHAGLANDILDRALRINLRHRGGAGMGGYCVANNTAQATALGTQGAGPCQIIVVHKANGIGAVGHYAANPDPRAILAGLVSMVVAVGGVPIDTIVFAAGDGVGPTNLQQKAYEMLIVAGASHRYPGATVLWPTFPAGEANWGSCIYLPLSSELALFDLLPGNFGGQADPGAGVSERNYRPYP